MVETKPPAQTSPRFAVHLVHHDLGKQRRLTLCERPIGLGDDAVIPYDVVTEAHLESVSCPQCLQLAGSRPRRWRRHSRPGDFTPPANT